MKWLIINTEAFSARGLKQKKTVGFDDLPWVVRRFLSVFPQPFIILDESSKIKVNTPMKESDKSSRTRTIKLLNRFGHRCIMTGTLMSKSPLNVVDQYNFLKAGYFPESMWEFAERYCVMITVRVGRGRRVIISQEDYTGIRKRLKYAFIRGGEAQLQAAKESVFRQFAIDYAKQEHIIRHRKYTPFINQRELIRRIQPDTVFVRREDVFDVRFEKFVKEPIMRKVKLSEGAKALANELVELNFIDNFALGKAPALELMTRLQDICNGFRPVEHKETKPVNGEVKEVRVITYEALPENPKVEALMELLEEIGVEHNQAVVWSSRKKLIEACAEAFTKEGYSYVEYDGSATDDEKQKAEELFQRREAMIFLANQASGAYGLNCLAQCDYSIFICIDGSVEKYHQAQHRLLRGQLSAPKFSYHIYAEGTVEERQQTALRVGQELIGAENSKETFLFI